MMLIINKLFIIKTLMIIVTRKTISTRRKRQMAHLRATILLETDGAEQSNLPEDLISRGTLVKTLMMKRTILTLKF